MSFVSFRTIILNFNFWRTHPDYYVLHTLRSFFLGYVIDALLVEEIISLTKELNDLALKRCSFLFFTGKENWLNFLTLLEVLQRFVAVVYLGYCPLCEIYLTYMALREMALQLSVIYRDYIYRYYLVCLFSRWVATDWIEVKRFWVVTFCRPLTSLLFIPRVI
jgi:hypothetical protein